MKLRYSVLLLASALAIPGVAHAGTTVGCFAVAANPFIVVTTPTVTVCANGQLFNIPNILVRGKTAFLPATTIDLGGGASFTVSAGFDADPFSNFTFGSVLPSGFGPITFDAFFSTPVVPGAYTNAASSGTLGITTTGGAGTTGSVSAGTYPAYIEGLADATNLGVDTGTGTCSVATPPSPNSISCNPPGASNSFGPISPLTLTAHLSYTHFTSGTGGSSAVAWSGSVTLDTTAVPEPATFALVFAGLLVVGGAYRSRTRG